MIIILSHYFWSLNKWEAHMQTVVIPTPFTWFGCKYPQIKADSLQLKHIVVVYRAKNVRIVSMSQYLWTWLYMRTCPFSSHLPRTYQSALNFLPARDSWCWESQFGVCGQRTPARRLTNDHPPSHSCLLHRCRLAALCSPSAHHLCGGITAGLPVSIGCHGWRILCLRLQSLSPGLHLGLLTQRLNHGS